MKLPQRCSDEDGNEINTGTWVVEEWYDYPGNMAHAVLHHGPNWRGDAMHQLDRLNEDQRWIWFGDGDDDDSDGDEIKNCILRPATLNFTAIDIFVSGITQTAGQISSPSEWFRWVDPKHTTTNIWHGYTTGLCYKL